MTFKKVLLFVLAASVGMPVFAQKKMVRKASRDLDRANTAIQNKQQAKIVLYLNRAKEEIDTALTDKKTRESADAWFTKASIYLTMQGNKMTSSGKPYQESYQALKKAFELDSKYKRKNEAVPVILQTAFYAFNDGVQTYNNGQYSVAFKSFHKVINLLGNTGDKRFADHKNVDTIRTQAKMLSGYAAYYSNQYKKAIPLLEEVKESDFLPKNQANIYLTLSQAYGKVNNSKKELATIEEGEQKFPDDENLQNSEINYYLESGNTMKLAEKFKEKTKAHPDNAQNYFNLGVLYEQMAHPDTGKASNKSEELSNKAKIALKKAVELDADNPKYNYQLAAHYYNLGAEVNNELSKMSVTENKAKYSALNKKRKKFFFKSLPYFEKAKTLYKPKAASLTGQDRNFYIQTLQALAKIYSIQNKLDKAKANRQLLKNL